MKKTFLIVASILFGQLALAQHTELSMQLSSGLFSFGGASAAKSSHVLLSDTGGPHRTNNPYGRQSGFSYGAGVTLQRITPSQFLFGIRAAYEALSAKVKIEEAHGEISWTVEKGNTVLTHKFINTYPFAGIRLALSDVFHADIRAGMDLATCLSGTEHFDLRTTSGENITNSKARNKSGLDIRPRLELVSYYQKFGLSLGYSHGLTNYTANREGGNPVTKSRYLRMGVSYRLK